MKVSPTAARSFRALQEWESGHSWPPTFRDWARAIGRRSSWMLYQDDLPELLAAGLVQRSRVERGVSTVPGMFVDSAGRTYIDAHHPFARDETQEGEE